MKHRSVLHLVAALALVAGTVHAQAPHAPAHRTAEPAVAEAEFRAAMTKLWEDHVTWTRLYIISALEHLADKSATTDRLLQNQADIGNAVKPFYGDAAGSALTALLKDHILIAAGLVDALATGDTAQVASGSAQWNANADEIATFLSGANPKNWPAPEMKAMMGGHLAATTSEVAARLAKDWERDVRAYDEVHAQILHMARMLSDGIVNQFPAKFH